MADEILGKGPDLVLAPFTPDQVEALWLWQLSHRFHPFTCPRRDDEQHGGQLMFGVDTAGVLVPTVRGWICPFCDYTQDWAHRFMCEKLAP